MARTRSAGGHCPKCSKEYKDLLEHIIKKHRGVPFRQDELSGTTLLACDCGKVMLNADGLSKHRLKGKCETAVRRSPAVSVSLTIDYLETSS